MDFEEVKAGPVMTCLAGLKNINDDQPILFNDCDHMFACDRFAEDMNSENWNYDGALLTFESNEPQFSYVQYENGRIVGTVEKRLSAIMQFVVHIWSAMHRCFVKWRMNICKIVITANFCEWYL